MKKIQIVCLLLLAGCLGCGQSDSRAPGTGGVAGTGGGGAGGAGNDGRDAGADAIASGLTDAMATWAAAKPGCAQYRYARFNSSVFGYCATTTVEVVNDQPVRRSFLSQEACGQTGGATEQWDEIGASQVGMHSDGAPALTVEELFSACKDILAEDPTTNTLLLNLDSHGVPVVCIFRPKACVDDCDMGFRLTSFSCDEPSTDGGADSP